MATVDPRSQPDRFPDAHSRLSYYINTYNALAMYSVLQAGTPAGLGGPICAHSMSAATRFHSVILKTGLYGRSATTGSISYSIAWW
jgi:Protein of unknown function, DUF547